MSLSSEVIPYGYCKCGCGKRTRIATRTIQSRNQIKGEPQAFVHGHNIGKTTVRYLIEDRGFTTPCWIWQKAINSGGYGNIFDPISKRSVGAHCVYYEREKGPIPDGYELDHLCKVRACVNPNHLEPVSKTENIRRGRVAKLNPLLVAEIRSLLLIGKKSVQEIAEWYEVSPSTVLRIQNEKSWSDIPEISEQNAAEVLLLGSRGDRAQPQEGAGYDDLPF